MTSQEGVPAKEALIRGPIRVLIADGDSLSLRALDRLLDDAVGIQVVAIASDEWGATCSAIQLRPAVALVNAGGTLLDGLEITRRLRLQMPTVQVIILSVYATFRGQAFAAGACRFLLKDCGRDELVMAIYQAAGGQCQKSTDGYTSE